MNTKAQQQHQQLYSICHHTPLPHTPHQPTHQPHRHIPPVARPGGHISSRPVHSERRLSHGTRAARYSHRVGRPVGQPRRTYDGCKVRSGRVRSGRGSVGRARLGLAGGGTRGETVTQTSSCNQRLRQRHTCATRASMGSVNVTTTPPGKRRVVST